MEMCYDGALMMPSSYAVMNEDEMIYVDGGGFYDTCMWMLTQAVGGIIGGVSFAAVCAVVSNSGAIYAAVMSAVAAIPWSRVIALTIITGVVFATARALSN